MTLQAEGLLGTKDSVGGSQAPLLEALLRRSDHYWDILVDILTDRDKYRETPRYRDPQPQTPRPARGLDKTSLTPQNSKGVKISLALSTKGDPDKVELLNEARMALADAAVFRSDTSQALGLYSRVKTAQAAWNQAQVCTLIIVGGVGHSHSPCTDLPYVGPKELSREEGRGPPEGH